MNASERGRRYDALIVDFLAPLLTGGTAKIGRPLSPALLADFCARRASHGDETARAEAQVFRAMSAIAPCRRVPLSDPGVMSLLLAAHDLSALTSPHLLTWPASRAVPTLLGWLGAHLAAVGAPTTRSQIVLRHLIVSRTLSLRRLDTTVKTWAYTHRFFGQPVPANVVSFPKVRAVRQETSTVPFPECVRASSISGGDVDGLLASFAACSPFDEALHCLGAAKDAALTPPPTEALYALLSDPRLRGALTYALATRGRAAEALSRLAHLLDHRPPEREAELLRELARDLETLERKAYA